MLRGLKEDSALCGFFELVAYVSHFLEASMGVIIGLAQLGAFSWSIGLAYEVTRRSRLGANPRGNAFLRHYHPDSLPDSSRHLYLAST